MDELVEGALAEGRVQGHHGPLATERHPRRHGQAVLLGDANVEKSPREALAEARQPVPVGMPAVIAQIRVVLRGEAD